MDLLGGEGRHIVDLALEVRPELAAGDKAVEIARVGEREIHAAHVNEIAYVLHAAAGREGHDAELVVAGDEGDVVGEGGGGPGLPPAMNTVFRFTRLRIALCGSCANAVPPASNDKPSMTT